jgi:hypothetical protein
MFKTFRSYIERLRNKTYLPTTQLRSGVPAKVEKNTTHIKSKNTMRSKITAWFRQFFS